jgi:hypothetical protein
MLLSNSELVLTKCSVFLQVCNCSYQYRIACSKVNQSQAVPFSVLLLFLLIGFLDCPNYRVFFFFLENAGIYSPNAYRGFAREFIKDLERIRLLSG